VAVAALAGRSEPWVLTRVAKQGIAPKLPSRRRLLFELADQIADRNYLRLPRHDRPRTRRQLGKLTRKAAPVPRQRRLTAASRWHALTRQAKTQLRQRPLPPAAAVAVAAIAGVVGGKLTGKLTLGLVVAFAGLVVAGMILTFLAERGAGTAGTQDADWHPR
jgi:hypothetical protein